MFLLFVICFSIQHNFQEMGYLGKAPELIGQDEAQIKGLMQRIDNNVTRCHANLKHQFQNKCTAIDDNSRKNLAIQILLCERVSDNKLHTVPEYHNDDQFIHDLSQQDLQVFTSFYNYIDIMCHNHAIDNQAKENGKKIEKIFGAIQCFVGYLNSLNIKTHEEKDKLTTDLADIKEQFEEDHESLNKVLNMIIDVKGNVTYITDVFSYVKSRKIEWKLYFTVTSISAGILFCFNSPISPILCFTGLMIYFEFTKYSYIISSVLGKSMYIAACVVLVLSSCYYHLLSIKKAFIDPFIH